MDIDKIIYIIREQRILKEFGVPPGAALGGGGGGTNALTSQASKNNSFDAYRSNW